MNSSQNAAEWFVTYGLQIFEIVGILAFALSGLIEAARKKLDLVGMAIVTGLASFGGGTLRDILLDRRPFFWVEHQEWIWVILIMCALALLFMRARHLEPTERSMQWPDALGLGIFAASGTQIALAMQMPALISVLMGVITGAFGGVSRSCAFADRSACSDIALDGAGMAGARARDAAAGFTEGLSTTMFMRKL